MTLFFRLNLKSVTIVTIIALITACAPTGEVADSNRQTVTSSTNDSPDRPLPYPIDVPIDYQSAISEGTRTETGEPGAAYWQNEASYHLQAELDTEEGRVYGVAQIAYHNNSPHALQQLVLELSQNLHQAGTIKKENTEITGGVELGTLHVRGSEVEEIVDETGYHSGESGYLVDATRLLIILDEPVEPGASIDIDVDWSFLVPNRGAGGRMGQSQGNLFFIGYWYPQVSVFDDVSGWFADPFVGNAEFYHPFADYTLEITAPDDWLVLATGDFLNPEEVLADHVYERYQAAGESDEVIPIITQADLGAFTQRNDEGKLTWRFQAERIRDVAFSATRESVWDGARAAIGDPDGDGSQDYTRINTIYRQSAPLWADQAEYAQHSISFLSEYLDTPYPWPHMTSVEGAGIIGGGMEYPMMTLMGSYNNIGAQQLHSVTAHEFAHMWIPMIVSNNERRYTWLDEGFTTFNTHQTMVDAYPADFTNIDVFRTYLQIAGTDYEGEMMRWSDYHYPGPAYGVASYPKPASILTALRGMLGEELFMEAYHTFINEWSYKNPYPWDFFNTVERVADQDLEWFWRSWYYETWVLDQAVASVNDEGDQITVEVQDLGDIPMPTTVRVILEDDTELEEEIPVAVWLEGERTATVTFNTGQPVKEVVIDPDFHFPDVDRANNFWEP